MKRRVLILYTGSSCRSQMAEAIFNARLGDRWEASRVWPGKGKRRPYSFPDPAKTNDLEDIRVVRDTIEHVDLPLLTVN